MSESHQYISDAISILKQLGFPSKQQQERSALTLLALLDLRPDGNWQDLQSPLMGVTPIMDWMNLYYQKQYAPNSRETVRRQTLHQFVSAGLILYNPDEPNRPVPGRVDEGHWRAARGCGRHDWRGQPAVGAPGD